MAGRFGGRESGVVVGMSVGARDATVRELVDVLEISAVGTAEAVLLDRGGCVPPTVHLISALPEQPYVGYVVSRPYRRGADAAAAIAGLGVLPAVMRATRLVLTWEHQDLCTALELPERADPAVVVVDAGPDEHEVRRHPFRTRSGPLCSTGGPAVVPEWGASQRERGGWLPEPVAALLATWRAGGDPRRLREVSQGMEQAGYTVRWVAAGS